MWRITFVENPLGAAGRHAALLVYNPQGVVIRSYEGLATLNGQQVPFGAAFLGHKINGYGEPGRTGTVGAVGEYPELTIFEGSEIEAFRRIQILDDVNAMINARNLPYEMPGLRALLFGYDADVTNSNTVTAAYFRALGLDLQVVTGPDSVGAGTIFGRVGWGGQILTPTKSMPFLRHAGLIHRQELL